MDMTWMLRLWIIGWLGVCVSLLILLFGLGLDVSRSPTWQVVLFYLLFIPFSLMWGGWAVFLFPPRVSGGGWRVLALGLSVLVPVVWLGWGSLGFRNPLLVDLLALFAVASALSVILYRVAWLRSSRGICRLAGFLLSDSPDEVRNFPWGLFRHRAVLPLGGVIIPR